MFNSFTREVEGRPPTHVEPVKRFAFKRPSIMTTIKALLVAGLITYSVKEWKPKPKNPQTSGTPSTNATQPTSGTPSTNGTQPISGTQPAYNGTSINTAELPSSTPTTVSGRNARREERPLGRRSRVDISSEFHVKSGLDAGADGIITTAGHLEARSFSEDIR